MSKSHRKGVRGAAGRALSKRRGHPCLVAILAVGLGAAWAEGAADAKAGGSALFPFVLPWDDSSPGVANLSGLMDKPAGKHGPIRAGSDGHLYAGDKRIRFAGVDLSFSANFPKSADAVKVAARMAKFGVNIVRFHIMDMRRFPDGLLARDRENTRDFDPEALDRLDYFIDQLGKNGIYTYLCLLNYRQFKAADGLPKEIEEGNPRLQDRHVIGFYDGAIFGLQKEYAARLLTHRNAHTGKTYAEDPAVAFVEINNENGLIHSWLQGKVDPLPEVFLCDLGQQWNAWVRRRHETTAGLREAWDAKDEPPGPEMLANGDFAQGLNPWTLACVAPAEGTADVIDDAPAGPGRGRSVRISVARPGAASWHTRFQQAGLKVEANQGYTLTFSAKADKPCALSVSIEQGHAPWHVLYKESVELAPQWSEFRFTPILGESDENVRVIFDPPQEPVACGVAGVSLRTGGVFGIGKNERVEDGTLPLLLRSRTMEYPVAMRRDWLRFLSETEERYWQGLYRYIKQDLKSRALVIGTVVGCSIANMMAGLDCVDTHAYWQHPIFPGRPWDAENYIVHNRTMVNSRGGVLPGMALRRVLHKPFCTTEYGFCAPNTHVSEGSILGAAYAGLQDWDYVSTSRYSHGPRWDQRCIRNYFDIDQHPTKMMAFLPAAAMILRGDVQPAKRRVVVGMDRERELEATLAKGGAWNLGTCELVGVPREAMLLHRVAIAIEGQAIPADALRPEDLKIEGDRFVSDTGELVWDLGRVDRGVVTVNTPRSKAVIGFGGGRRFDLGGVVFEPGPTMQDGWSVVTLTQMEGEPLRPPARWLITATGYVENSKMGWKNPEKNSVGKDWGEAPTLVEGIPARISLPIPAGRIAFWALDERGQRKTQVPVEADRAGNAVVILGPRHRTLWYEVICNDGASRQ